MTLHSFAGVGAGDLPLDQLVSEVAGNTYTKARWTGVDLLVVDVVSMLSGNFLDDLDFVAKRVRNDSRPFGGLQLLLCGDFLAKFKLCKG